MYVDDIIIAGKCTASLDQIKSNLQKKCVMKELGQPDVFLWINTHSSQRVLESHDVTLLAKLQ